MSVTGSVTGPVTAPATGSVTGPAIGPVTGPVIGSVTGPVAVKLRIPRKGLDAAVEAVNERPRLWLTFAALLLAVQIRPWWFPQADGVHFLSMARSLAVEGHMRNLGSPHLWYFPGYSLLLSPLYLVSDRPWWLLSAFQWCSAILFLVGVYYWARTIAPQWAVWIAGLSVLNEGVWIHCARTMSEVPFMCGLIWSTNAALAAARSRSWQRAFALGAIGALLLALTSLIRPAGILLAVGFGLHLGWKAWQNAVSWRRAAALTLLLGIPGSLAIAGFLQSERRTAAESHARTYLDNFSDSAATPLRAYVEGLRLAVRDSGRVIIPGMFKSYQERGWRDLNLLIFVPACAVLALGWWRLVLETADPLLLMAPFYVLLYIIYPYEAGARFYVPLLPVFAASFVRLLDSWPSRRPLFVAGILGAHLALAAGYWLWIDAPRGRVATARWRAIDPIAQAIVGRQDRVTAWNATGDDIFMLEVALDRHVPFSTPKSISPEVEWIVAKPHPAAVAGFEPCARTEGLCLLRRQGSF